MAACDDGDVVQVVEISSDSQYEIHPRVTKALKKLEFSCPGPQMKPPRKKSRLREKQKDVHDVVSRDVCDCTEVDCPGCFFPCPKCRSNKCGVVCRVGRDWIYYDAVQTDTVSQSAA